MTMGFQAVRGAKAMLGIALACLAMVACGKQQAPAQDAAASAPAPGVAASDLRQTPVHAVLIVPPGKTAPADLPQTLAAWKSAGVLSDAVLVKKFGFKVKDGYGEGFDQFAVLDFPGESAYDAWKSGDAAGLGPDVIVSRVDVLRDRRSRKNNPAESIFVVGQYESLVSPQQYQDYTDTYVEPNMANQYASGIMTRYTMYLEREPSGGLSHPKAILVTEYANQAEYERKSAVKDAYKAVLLSGTHPEWASINASKHSIRTSLAETFAHPVAVP